MSSSVNPELFVSGISMLRRWKRNGSGAKDGRGRANKESRKWDQKSIPLGNCNRRAHGGGVGNPDLSRKSTERALHSALLLSKKRFKFPPSSFLSLSFSLS